MNWDYIISAAAAVALVLLTRYAIPALREYVTGKKANELAALIEQLVTAAEQLFPEEKSGAEKLEYVQGMLAENGVRLDDSTRAAIESAVYRLPVKGGGADD